MNLRVSSVHVERLFRGQRRAMAAASPRAFARVYLPHHFTLGSSRMHDDLFELLGQAARARNARIAVAAPRGHAKTTIACLANVLWCTLFGCEHLVLILSETREQAVQRLADLRRELTGNELLLADFPELRGPRRPWKENYAVLPNGAAIKVLGSGQAIRGVKHGEHRPGLIIADDLEGQAQIESPEQRAKLREWFERSVLKAGGPGTNIIVIGTILHHDALLAHLTRPQPRDLGLGWTARKFRAIEAPSSRPDLWDHWEKIYSAAESFEEKEGPQAALAFFRANQAEMLRGSRVLWPEREGYLELQTMRLTEGQRSFQAEKQNEPLDEAMCLFAPSKFRYWDATPDSEREVQGKSRNRWRIVGAMDPSLGKRGGAGDYTAIVTVARDDKSGLVYVLGAELMRRSPDEIIERVLSLHKVFDYDQFVVESNQFQEVLADQLAERARARGRRLWVDKVNHTGHKQARVESIEPLVAQGKLLFSRRHTALLEQLQQFPLGSHDDGPDALEMAVTAVMRSHQAFKVWVPF